jgi:tetratricopeptide (TPR) repeat protein
MVNINFYDKVINSFTTKGKISKADKYKKLKKKVIYSTLMNKGREFYRVGESEKASEEFKKAYKLGPENFNTNDHITMGNVLLETGEEFDAKKHFEKAIENQPEEAGVEVYKIWGYGLLNKKRLDVAVEPLKKALTLMRKYPSQSNESDIDDFKSDIETGLKHRGQEEKRIKELLRKVGFD